MKKFFLALLALPLLGVITACSDSDKPDVDINISYGTDNRVVDGKVYVVAGNDFVIESVNVQAKDQSKKAALGPVTYYLLTNDGNNKTIPLLIGTTPVEPYAMKIPTVASETSGQTDEPGGTDTPTEPSKQYLVSNVPIPVGVYQIQMVMPVYQVDCELATGYVTVDVEVVASESDLPPVQSTPQEPVSPVYK